MHGARSCRRSRANPGRRIHRLDRCGASKLSASSCPVSAISSPGCRPFRRYQLPAWCFGASARRYRQNKKPQITKIPLAHQRQSRQREQNPSAQRLFLVILQLPLRRCCFDGNFPARTNAGPIRARSIFPHPWILGNRSAGPGDVALSGYKRIFLPHRA